VFDFGIACDAASVDDGWMLMAANRAGEVPRGNRVR
jgi:hypothetical protein